MSFFLFYRPEAVPPESFKEPAPWITANSDGLNSGQKNLISVTLYEWHNKESFAWRQIRIAEGKAGVRDLAEPRIPIPRTPGEVIVKKDILEGNMFAKWCLGYGLETASKRRWMIERSVANVRESDFVDVMKNHNQLYLADRSNSIVDELSNCLMRLDLERVPFFLESMFNSATGLVAHMTGCAIVTLLMSTSKAQELLMKIDARDAARDDHSRAGAGPDHLPTNVQFVKFVQDGSDVDLLLRFGDAEGADKREFFLSAADTPESWFSLRGGAGLPVHRLALERMLEDRVLTPLTVEEREVIHDAGPNLENARKNTAFHFAARIGDARLLGALFNAWPNAEVDVDGLIAVASDSVVQVLLEKRETAIEDIVMVDAKEALSLSTVSLCENESVTHAITSIRKGQGQIDLKNALVRDDDLVLLGKWLSVSPAVDGFLIENVGSSSIEWGAAAFEVFTNMLMQKSALVTLILKGCNLSADHTALISALLKTNTALTTLNLERNKIGAEGGKAIGEALKTNTALNTLNLKSNEIGDEGGKAIGEALKTNTAMKDLNLQGNEIGAEGGRVIGEALKTNTTLNMLYLEWNKIGAKGGKTIGEALKTNATLNTLNLERNKIGAEGGKAIGDALKTNNALNTLNLYLNEIGAGGCKAIGEGLKTNTALITFNLAGNNIGAEGGKAIGEALKTNTAMKDLNLEVNNIGAEGGKSVGEALTTNAVLTELNLRNNNIGEEGGKAIGEALKTNMVLTTVHLKDNRIGSKGGKVIGEALKTNTVLNTLNLESNEIGDEGAQVIGGELKTNAALSTLNLYNNKIGNEGGKAIGEALKINTALCTLNLELNNIGAEGGKAIGVALKTNTALTTLNLDDNQIGAEGGKAIGETLKTNTALHTLNLNRNNIGEEGGMAIGEALKTNTALNTLNLHRNKISNDGGKAIGEALKTNTALKDLNLWSIDIGAEGGKAIGEALKTNTALKDLNLNSNEIGAEGGKAIGESLKTNTTLNRLYLYNNKIGNEGGKSVGEALTTNAVLTELNLTSNEIGEEGGKAIGEALKTNAALNTLNLRDNQIGAEGGKAIGDALKTNLALKDLNLWENEIGDEGGKAIGNALKTNMTLHTLNLDVNQIGAEGGTAIGEALKTNTALKELYLGGNQIGSKGGKAIGEALKINTVLHTLILSQNNIGNDGAKTISDALKTNTALKELNIRANRIASSDFFNFCETNRTLKILDISSNDFHKLPISILDLQLFQLEARENPWVNPPREVTRYGLPAIRSYLERIKREGSRVCTMAKLLVIGLPEAGKTSLLKSIELSDPNGKMAWPEGHHDTIKKPDGSLNRTVGIDRVEWKPSVDTVRQMVKEANKDLPSLDVTVYDFAGQDEYMVTHQLFLSSRAVYAVVFDISVSDLELKLAEMIDPWLDSIQSKAPGLRVILVATHVDKILDPTLLDARCNAVARHVAGLVTEMQRDREDTNDEPRFDRRTAAPAILGFEELEFAARVIPSDMFGKAIFRVSSLEGSETGIHEVRDAFMRAIIAREDVGFKLPITYGVVLDFVGEAQKKSNQPVASHIGPLFDQFQLWVSSRPGTTTIELDDFREALGFWHGLGVVFEHGDLVFVSPSFVLELVRAVVKSREKYAEFQKAREVADCLETDFIQFISKAELSKELLEQYLLTRDRGKELFPKTHHAELIGVLEHLGVMRPMESADMKWLVPALVVDEIGSSETRSDECAFVRRFAFSFVPFAFLLRLHTEVPGRLVVARQSWGEARLDTGGRVFYRVCKPEQVFSKRQYDVAVVGQNVLRESARGAVVELCTHSEADIKTLLDVVFRTCLTFPGLQFDLFIPLRCLNAFRDLHVKVPLVRKDRREPACVPEKYSDEFLSDIFPCLSNENDICLKKLDLKPTVPDLPTDAVRTSEPVPVSNAISFSPRLPSPAIRSENLHHFVRASSSGATGSRLVAFQVIEYMEPLIKPLVLAISAVHGKSRLLGNPISGRCVVDPRFIEYDTDHQTMRVDAESLPLMTSKAQMAKDIPHIQRLFAFMMLGCEWDAAFVSLPLVPDVADQLEKSFFFEAADIVRTTFSSLDSLFRHPFFWTEEESCKFLTDVGDTVRSEPFKAGIAKDKFEANFSAVIHPLSADWSCVPKPYLRLIQNNLNSSGFVPDHARRQFNGKCPVVGHMEYFNQGAVPDCQQDPAAHKCKPKCSQCFCHQLLEISAFLRALRNSYVHCEDGDESWDPENMESVCKDEFLGMFADNQQRVTSEEILRYFTCRRPHKKGALPAFLSQRSLVVDVWKTLQDRRDRDRLDRDFESCKLSKIFEQLQKNKFT